MKGAARPLMIGIGLALLAVAGILGARLLRPDEDRSAAASGLTEVSEPEEIRNLVELSRLGILTSTSYIGHKVYVIRGTLKNISNMPLRGIDVKMTFTDYDGNSVEEGEYAAFETKQKPLEPGTEYRFELNFENLPRTWNYRVPQTEVVRVTY